MAWQKRRRLVQPLADAVAWQARALRLPRPLERVRVQFTLIHSRGRLRDADNAQSSCKELLDALVDGGVLVDDGPAHVELVAGTGATSAQAGRAQMRLFLSHDLAR
jgi:Holliday junction resolvase RusA-like endonuclease